MPFHVFWKIGGSGGHLGVKGIKAPLKERPRDVHMSALGGMFDLLRCEAISELAGIIVCEVHMDV